MKAYMLRLGNELCFVADLLIGGGTHSGGKCLGKFGKAGGISMAIAEAPLLMRDRVAREWLEQQS